MPEISPTPLWMQEAAAPPLAEQALPAQVDVLIVGAGYTGLSAARETASSGRSTLVLDSAPLGGGCSSRNGGQVAYSIKPAFESLKSRHGAEVALGICREGIQAVAELRSMAREQGVDCDWRENG